MPSSLMTAGGGLSKSKLRLADAEEGNVLINKTFYGGEDKLIRTGTMPDNGAVDYTVAPGESVTIPAGYHNGSGVVRGTKETFVINSAEYTTYTYGGTINVSVDYSSHGLTKVPIVHVAPVMTRAYMYTNGAPRILGYEVVSVTTTTAVAKITCGGDGDHSGGYRFSCFGAFFVTPTD